MRFRTFLITLPFSLVAACATAQRPAASPRPTLIVFITVDQMRSDYFQRFDKQLTGGLRTLFDGSAFFVDGYQDHAITETAPGHSVTLSGRFPVHTGITMNSAGVNGVADAAIIGSSDRSDLPAAPVRFQGTTLIDWLKAANPETRFLSVSRKDRGAILPIGRSKGDVYWWTISNGTFSTSHYYRDTLPTWVQRFNARKPGQQYAGKAWTLLLPESAYPEPDSVPAENRGANYTFPHFVSEDSLTAARSAAAYPWMDEITLQFALAGLKELGLGGSPNRTDVLAISLSTTDAVGHAFGPDSREMHDQILRLDRYLGVFLDSLFKLRDRRHVVIALTADHGMSPLPAMKSTIYPNHDAKVVSIAPAWKAFRARLAAAGVDSAAVSLEDAAVVVVEKPEAFAGVHVRADSAIESFAKDVRQRRRRAPRGSRHVSREGRHDDRRDRAPLAAHVRARRRGAAHDNAHAVQLLGARDLSDARITARQRRARAGVVLRRRREAGTVRRIRSRGGHGADAGGTRRREAAGETRRARASAGHQVKRAAAG